MSQELPAINEEMVRRLEEAPHCRELGLKIVEARPGECVMRFDYTPRFAADPASGILHGGAVTSLLDTACGMALMSCLEQQRPVATLDLRIDYLKPATPGKAVIARAEVYKMTRHVAFLRGVAYHDDTDNLIANCASTYMITGTGGKVT